MIINQFLLSKKELKAKIEKKGKQIDQQTDNIMPDSIASEESINKQDFKTLNMHDVIDELSNQKLTNQPLLFRAKIDQDGKHFEIIMPFKHKEAFEKISESIFEHLGKGSIIA